MKASYFSFSFDPGFIEEDMQLEGKVQKIQRRPSIRDVSLCLPSSGVTTNLQQGEGNFEIYPASDDTLLQLRVSVDWSWEGGNLKMQAAAEKAVEVLTSRPEEIHSTLRVSGEKQQGIYTDFFTTGPTYTYHILNGDQPWIARTLTIADLLGLAAIAQQVLAWLVAHDKEIYGLRQHR